MKFFTHCLLFALSFILAVSAADGHDIGDAVLLRLELLPKYRQ